GVAHEHAGDDWKSLISRADRALYRAKAEGRDQIVLSPPELATDAPPILENSLPGEQDRSEPRRDGAADASRRRSATGGGR
ncbi:MAG: hypothetical protein INR65_14175, partial [Gluconacetobacter diazotrophicus]|nr:hypothetical protein [Gluconacetobacter diazotrophicus]